MNLEQSPEKTTQPPIETGNFRKRANEGIKRQVEQYREAKKIKRSEIKKRVNGGK
jgi:hypothetical protein